MAVAFDAAGPSGGAGTSSTSTSPLTWVHTCGASATSLIVGVTSGFGAGNAVTGVTYAGSACTLLAFRESATASAGGIAMYYLAGPATGAGTVSVTFNTSDGPVIGGSMSYTGSSAHGTAMTASTSGNATVSGTVSSTTTGGMISAVACYGGGVGGGTFSGADGVTVEFQKSLNNSSAANNGCGGNVASSGGGANQVVGFSDSAFGDDWGLVAVELLPTGGGTTYPESLTALTAVSPAVARSAGKKVAGTATARNSLQRAIGNFLITAVASDLVRLTGLWAHFSAGGISASASTSTGGAMGVLLTATAAVRGSVTRSTTRTLAASIAVANALTGLWGHFQALGITVGGGVQRGVAKGVSVTATATASAVRRIARRIIALAAAPAQLIVSFGPTVIPVLLTATAALTGRTTRSAGKAIAALASAAGHTGRGIARRLTAGLAAVRGFVSAIIPGGAEGPFNILLPGGDVKVVKSALSITLRPPGVSLQGYPGTFGALKIVLPALKTALAGRDYYSRFRAILPAAKTSLAGRDYYSRLAVRLPAPKAALAGNWAHAGGFAVLFGQLPMMMGRLRRLFARETLESPPDPVDWITGNLKVNWKVGMPATEWNVGYTTASIYRLSTEYLVIPVAATKNGSPYDPTSDTLQFAFAPTLTYVPQTGDWVAGVWETDDSNLLYPYSAKCLVGPNGATTLVPGNYVIYVKITDNPEVPVQPAGQLTIS